MSSKEWTLTQIAKLLCQPQYKLIYLCEKGVILPDGVDAKGRGSSRRFSARNLFEFMIAFTLGDFHIPTKITTNLLRALRSFEKHLAKKYPLLKLPYSLTYPDCPEVKAILIKGSYLYFAIGKANKPVIYIGGINLMEYDKNPTSLSFDAYMPETEFSVNRVESLPIEAGIAYFELNLSQIAKEIPLT